MASDEPAPIHPFEVRITIGGETWDYVLRTMEELSQFLEKNGPDHSNGLMSGGGGGSHSVTVSKRDVTPQKFREELSAWHDRIVE